MTLVVDARPAEKIESGDYEASIWASNGNVGNAYSPLAIDDEGGLWVALWGGSAVRRYDVDGVLSEQIDLPATNVTSRAFAGRGGSELFITTSMQGVDADAEPDVGAVFRTSVGACGVAKAKFAG